MEGSLSAAWEGVRVYCSRTERGIKFHTGMKGFSLLTNDIWGERHTKSTQDDSASAVRLAGRHLFILFMTWEFHPSCLFKCSLHCSSRASSCCNTSLTSAPCMFDMSHSAVVTGPAQQMSAFPVDCFSKVICLKKTHTQKNLPLLPQIHSVLRLTELAMQKTCWSEIYFDIHHVC